MAIFGTPALIAWLSARGIGQQIREDGPKGHHTKAGTPTMGGLAIMAAALAGYLASHIKTVFTQRLKRAGMRWHAASGQVIVDLRVLHRSGTWDEVVRRDLQGRTLPETVRYHSSAQTTRRKAG